MGDMQMSQAFCAMFATNAIGLQGDEAWMQYSGPDGALQHLLDEQQDVLVGPRPEKPPPMSQSSMTEGGQSNGNVLPEQLIRFLQNMTSGGSRF